MYACGLRLGEAIHLQVPDIDGQRKFIHVRHGKGAKDRLVPVAESALTLLRAYYKTHRNRTWVFPALGKTGKGGPTTDQPVSETTVHGALRRAVVETGIRKPVRPHTLRHSYATHMIEAGVPVRHVQECLGHESLASTMIYLHITSHGKEDSRQQDEPAHAGGALMSRIQQLFRDHAGAYLEQFGPAVPEAHRRVIQAVCDCRSGACGHHLFACPQCGRPTFLTPLKPI